MLIDYNRLITPPAPFVSVAVAHPLRPAQLQAFAAKKDTAADITALPLAQVQLLALPQKNLLEIAGYNNQPEIILTYDASLELAYARVRLEVVAIPEDYAFLGRDVLNLLRLLLDGPALTLEILSPS
ncbi:MAG: hypothetical protein AAB217_07090 [Chloroflexota bacterium]